MNRIWRDGAGPDGVVLVGEQSGRTTHYVDGVHVSTPALGRTLRAVCRRAFLPAALAAPLTGLCPECAAALTTPPRRRGRRRRNLRRKP